MPSGVMTMRFPQTDHLQSQCSLLMRCPCWGEGPVQDEVSFRRVNPFPKLPVDGFWNPTVVSKAELTSYGLRRKRFPGEHNQRLAV